MGGESIHWDLGLGLDGHGLEIDGEEAVHVAGVDNLVPREGHGAGRARRAMVDAELLLVVMEVLDTILDARHGSFVLFHELRGILGLFGHVCYGCSSLGAKSGAVVVASRIHTLELGK